MRPQTLWILVFLVGCDEPDDPSPDCAAWLSCYEACHPLRFEGLSPWGARGIDECGMQCAVETPWESISATEVSAADRRVVDDADSAAVRFESALAAFDARATCAAGPIRSAPPD